MLTFRDYGSQMIGERLDKMLSMIEKVRAAEDIEGIHDMRVASRRLRAAFSVFAPAFPYRRYKEMEGEVRNITQALSEARELDVLLADLDTLMKKLPRNQRGALERLIERVGERRSELDPVVLAALARLEAIDLREDLAFIAERIPSDDDPASLDQEASKVLKQRVDAIEAMGVYADDPARVLELHEMRIAAKKLRYTMELFAPFRDKWFSAAIERVRSLQEALGEIHDTDVLIPRLIAHARRELKGGIEPNGLGAYDVDLDGVAGLLRACQLKRTDRDAAYGKLSAEWKDVQLGGLLKKIAENEEAKDEKVRG